MDRCIYIYIYICTYTYGVYTWFWDLKPITLFCRDSNIRERAVHPVSITRFPLRRVSPGAGLLRNPCFTL